MAQERKKRRIVLASVLKPVDDTRMLEKLGKSIAQTGLYEVYIIGREAGVSQGSKAGVHLIPIPAFGRLSLARVVAKWRIFGIIRSLRPDIIIVGTHELLFPAFLLKLLSGTRIIYDIRENYYRNVLMAGTFPGLIAFPLALLVRAKEKVISPFVDHFFLSEAGYDKEFSFHRRRWTVLENKAVGVHRRMASTTPGRLRLLFSGTLSESTGVFAAIRLADGLHALHPETQLAIAGYAALPPVMNRLYDLVKTRPYVRLIGGSTLVPHTQIVTLINESDAGILAYPRSPHTENSRPTKLFEYLAAGLPIILEGYWPWIREFEVCQPFVLVNFEKPDFGNLLNQLKSGGFYTQEPKGIHWEDEVPRLLKVLQEIVPADRAD